MDAVTFGRVNITQAITTAIAIVGLFGLLFAVVRQALFKAWTDWKISQLEANNLILKKQQELANQIAHVEMGQSELQSCIHSIPGHPENKAGGESKVT